MTGELVRLESLGPIDGGVEARILVDPGRMRTSQVPGLSERMLSALPGLGSHECVNGAGRTFPEEAGDTEVAHLLEHVALELLRRGASRMPRGGTRWDFAEDGRGSFTVTLLHEDAEKCALALREAVRVLSAAVRGDAVLAADAAIEFLRGA